MKRLPLVFLCAALTSAAVPSRAIELSLEENRAGRGSTGFVDMKRLFKASPDAARAREGLEELVRQAEELVNARKAEILRLRQDLGALGIEREELSKSTPTIAAPVLATPSMKSPQMPAPAASTQTTPATINLPGMPDGPTDLGRPGASPLNPTRDHGVQKQEPSPLAVSTRTAPTPAPVLVQPAAGPTLAQRLLELDGRIAAKQSELERLQGELDRERLGAEHDLLDAEGRKTDQVLARLYRAISEVAKREGISVVVDKSATIYGHPTVDLTEKILKQLQGAAPTQ